MEGGPIRGSPLTRGLQSIVRLEPRSAVRSVASMFGGHSADCRGLPDSSVLTATCILSQKVIPREKVERFLKDGSCSATLRICPGIASPTTSVYSCNIVPDPSTIFSANLKIKASGSVRTPPQLPTIRPVRTFPTTKSQYTE